jgi:hypothetical protein
MSNHIPGRVSALFMCIMLSVALCNRYPGTPDYQGIGDCGRPTVPPGLNFDDTASLVKSAADSAPFIISPPVTASNIRYGYLEIYDYEKNLIQTSQNVSVSVPATWQDTTNGAFNVYWDGLDSKGNKVDNGRYVAKMSFISKKDTTCTCSEFVLTTN